jgi:hypothetical protein
MKKFFVSLFALISIVLSAYAADPIFLSFGVDDFEEAPSSLNVQGISSNTNLFSSIISSQLSSNGISRQLSFISKANGNSQISVSVCDNGFYSQKTSFVNSSPGISSTNTDGNLVIVSGDNQSTLYWNYAPNLFGYKINRFSTNHYGLDKTFTIGTTTNNFFIDNGVSNGNTYWYTISWINPNSPQGDSSCTNIAFEMRIRTPLPLYNIIDGLVFQARSNAIYQVYYKVNLNELTWTLWQELPLINGQIVRYQDSGGFFRDRIFYVREKE